MVQRQAMVNDKTEKLLEIYRRKFDNVNFESDHGEAYLAVHHFLSRKGTRVRPLLLLHCCQFFNGDVQKALYPAFGIELFHYFTMVHREIMNESVSSGSDHEFTPGTTILAGDFMMILAYRYLAKVDPAILSATLQLLNEIAIGIFEGQMNESEMQAREVIDEPDYLKIVESKTAILLAGCCKVGAMIAGAKPQDLALIYDFGMNLGMAWRLKNDGVRMNRKSQKSEMIYEYDSSSIIVKTGLSAEFENISNEFYRKAIDKLESIEVNSERQSALREFAEGMYNLNY